jgi:NAD+ synthase
MPVNDKNIKQLKSKLIIDSIKTSAHLENFINKHLEKLNREGIILGLSGGIDSVVTAILCKRAVGSDKVLALVMPEKDSKKRHINDAIEFSNEIGIQVKIIDISKYLKEMGVYKLFPLNKLPIPDNLKDSLVKRAYNFYNDKVDATPFSASMLGFEGRKYKNYLQKYNAYYRVKHRLRALLLYLYGELENRLVVGAANKSEYKIGFFVKFGCDHLADIMPLIDLYKTQVRSLAKCLEVPLNILEKAPTPDILPGLTDEMAIGITYEKLDLILAALENKWEVADISKVLEISESKILYVKQLIHNSEHMRVIFTPNNY